MDKHFFNCYHCYIFIIISIIIATKLYVIYILSFSLFFYSFANSFPIEAITEYWAEFPVLYSGPCWYTYFRYVFVQSLSRVRFFATPWTAARQASLSFTISWSFRKLMSIESMMPSNHLILSPPSPPAFSHSQVFSIESALRIRWQKYWNFSFSISPSNEYSVLVSFRIDWFDLLAV